MSAIDDARYEDVLGLLVSLSMLGVFGEV